MTTPTAAEIAAARAVIAAGEKAAKDAATAKATHNGEYRAAILGMSDPEFRAVNDFITRSGRAPTFDELPVIKENANRR